MESIKATIVDYGMGNLGSVEKAFQSLGVETLITQEAQAIKTAHCLVLPGQGAFGAAMEQLNQLQLTPLIKDHILSGKPYLGICLGLQLLFEVSEESKLPGLGVFPGSVQKFKPEDRDTKVPHMGWNMLSIDQPTPFFTSLPEHPFVYFVHSYYVVPKDSQLASSHTTLEDAFVSSIAQDKLFACQFHPEKSGSIGIQIMKNFMEGIR